MNKQAKILATLDVLRKEIQGGGTLEIGTPFGMLVAVILSARTKDEQVLKLLPGLFKKYRAPETMAKASVDDIAKRINSIGMYKQKAKNLKAMAQRLVDEFDGEVPRTLEELISLSGVGRKTASVILVGAFGKSAIAVDTHVFRIVHRLGWVTAKTPEEMEKKLLGDVPKARQKDINHTFVQFGRSICVPGKPRCWACPIAEYCDFKNKNLERPKDSDEILKKANETAERLVKLKNDVCYILQ